MLKRNLLKKRKKIFLLVIRDLFIIYSSYLLSLMTLGIDVESTKLTSFIFLLIWPILSYLFERYEKDIRLENSFKFLLKIILISILLSVLYNTCAVILDLIRFKTFDFKVSYSYLILTRTLLINLILNIFLLIFLKYFKINKSSIETWHHIGSKESKNNLLLMLRKSKYKNNYAIKEFKIEKKYKLDNIKLIIDHESEISKEERSFIKNNIEKISLLLTTEDWFENTFEMIPTNLFNLDNIYLLKQIYSRNNFKNKVKRISDILISFFLIILLFPIIIIFSLLIWLEDKGPILYKQKRVGLNGTLINIYKLRSMKVDAEDNGIKWAERNDPRTTFVGRFMRRSRIDELPQLISVLFGEMSLIGPRPERPEIEKILKEKIPNYNLKYLVKPGLSGWAQVNYRYGSSINDSKKKLSYDIYYIKNKSVSLDFLIFLKTIRIILNFKKYGSN